MKKQIAKLFLILLLLSGIIITVTSLTTNYVIVRFDELGPLVRNMAAYYNGFKIGRITNIEPDKDFEHTLVKVAFTQKEINLPQNTTVHVERFPNGEIFLQFIYPDSPSFKKIARGDTLEGLSPYSLEEFMQGQNISGVTDIVSIHVIKALNATEIANMEMTNFFKNTSRVINENSKGIKASVDNAAAMTKSLAQTAENLNQASKKLNNAIDEKTLKDTTTNLKDTTSNIKNTTDDIAKATENIDSTRKKIDDTISQINSTAQNLNSITSGLNETLGHRFGGMKIMFGTPIKPNDNKSCTKNACD